MGSRLQGQFGRADNRLSRATSNKVAHHLQAGDGFQANAYCEEGYTFTWLFRFEELTMNLFACFIFYKSTVTTMLCSLPFTVGM
jgi:hypothetical protein